MEHRDNHRDNQWTRMIAVSVFLAGCILGSTQVYARLLAGADEQAFYSASLTWQDALRTQNFRSMFALSLKTARFHPLTGPSIMGNQWLASASLVRHPVFTLDLGADPEELRVSGDMRYQLSSYEASLRDSQGKVNTRRGEHITLWKKDSNGEWKVSVDVFTSAK